MRGLFVIVSLSGMFVALPALAATQACVAAHNRLSDAASSQAKFCAIGSGMHQIVNDAIRECGNLPGHASMRQALPQSLRECSGVIGNGVAGGEESTSTMQLMRQQQALQQAERDAQRSDEYMTGMAQCDNAASSARVSCKDALTKSYQAGGVLVVNTQGKAGGSVSQAGEQPDDDDPQPPPRSGSGSTANDPNSNYEGKPCSYFTCNAVRKDGGGKNYHGEGAAVIYGKTMYMCRSGAWVKRGPASTWLPEAEGLRAEVVERGCVN